jgi:tartrate dehydratase alpha subunit/fumarate hydratase class I-like protein
MASKVAGLSFAAHPAAFAIAVNLTCAAKLHLATTHYNDVPRKRE